MATVKVYNLEGAETGTVELDDSIFNISASPSLMYQVVQVLRARQRQPLAHTKDRSEVRGGGKKPWKQKGTGRARHGSIRSPLWRGGGVTFGPRKESLTKPVVPKQMNKKALRAALSEKVATGSFMVIEDMTIEKPSTKTFVKIFDALQLTGKKVLFLSNKEEAPAAVSVRNIQKVDPVFVGNINVLEVLGHGSIMISKKTLEVLTKQLS